jgi:exopolysaccharide biosynthesis polyprenyl glycosylphosphotransferase
MEERGFLSDRRQTSVGYVDSQAGSPAVGLPPAKRAREAGSGAPLLDVWRTSLLVGWDVVSALTALCLAGGLFASGGWAVSLREPLRWLAWPALALLTVTTQFYFDAYRVEVLRSRSRACFQSLKATVVSGVLFLLGLALLSRPGMVRQEAVATLCLLAVSTLGIRVFLRDAIGFPVRHVLVARSCTASDELIRALERDAGYAFAGFVEDAVDARGLGWGAPTVSLSTLPQPGRRSGPILVVTPDGAVCGATRTALRQAGVGAATIFPQDRFYESLTGRVATLDLGPGAEQALHGLQLEPALLALKRVGDTLAAAALLAAALPAMLVVAVLVKLTSPGPCLYSQVRVGRDGRSFRLWKFRSMRCDAEAASGPVWAARNDPRVTPLGRLLRRSRLDELPQLWNVVRGDMSLVGPRPERPVFVARFHETIPFYVKRLAVRPGLTGWAQVWHRYDETEADVTEKLQYDLFYIKHWSVLLDLQIAIKTIATVLTGNGSR